MIAEALYLDLEDLKQSTSEGKKMRREKKTQKKHTHTKNRKVLLPSLKKLRFLDTPFVTLPLTINEPLKRFLFAAHRNAEIILAVTVYQ